MAYVPGAELSGIRGSLPFIDGADLRKPEFSHYAADGSGFIIEGHGVDPDIEVWNDPWKEFSGEDEQLKQGHQGHFKRTGRKTR